MANAPPVQSGVSHEVREESVLKSAKNWKRGRMLSPTHPPQFWPDQRMNAAVLQLEA
jgi:hypothetical protein